MLPVNTLNYTHVTQEKQSFIPDVSKLTSQPNFEFCLRVNLTLIIIKVLIIII